MGALPISRFWINIFFLLLASGELIARSLGQSQWVHSSARDIAGSVLTGSRAGKCSLFIPGKTEFPSSLVVKGKQLTAGPVLPGIFEHAVYKANAHR